jgi:peptide/nickel transport system ATP-binding protein
MTAQARKRLSVATQIIFQDPMAALDPRMTVGDQIAEPLLIHLAGDAQSRRARAAALIEKVGLTTAQLDNYPHEFSGGQRQRICIARALALTPKLIIADESVSALDVSVQARVLDLLRALKDEFGIAMLFISHDMAVVENISDRVAVMHLGQIVEVGSRAQIFGNPQHPYTRRLMAAVPIADPKAVRPATPRMSGEIPNPVHPAGVTVARHEMTQVDSGHLVAAQA